MGKVIKLVLQLKNQENKKMNNTTKSSNLYSRIFEAVSLVPKKKVSTYGQIAKIVNCSPRVVGYAMHTIKEEDNIPWFRVINSKGKISFPKDSEGYFCQRAILESEGIIFSEKGKINLKKFGWIPQNIT